MRYRLSLFNAAFCICVLASISHAQNVTPLTPGISVGVSDIVQLPRTTGQIISNNEDNRVRENWARINFLREDPLNANNWYVNDLRGFIYKVDKTTGATSQYLNFQTRSETSGFITGTPGGLSTGLITFAFHPDFATNGKLYTFHEAVKSGTPTFSPLNYTSPTTTQFQDGVLREWTATDPTASTFSGTSREVMRVRQRQGNLHNFGDIAFNPTLAPGDPGYGLMYIAGGDGGLDTTNTAPQAQNLNSIFGKLLRIDPLGTNGVNGQYGIAADNVFASDGNINTRGEIYASGFRNLHRIAFDPVSGQLIGTDIGQNAAEEVNILRNGENYGWGRPGFEGTFAYNSNGSTSTLTAAPANRTAPAVQFFHDIGNAAGESAIAGGFVYRGTAIPELYGKFVYGEIVSGRLLYSDLQEMNAADQDGNYFTQAAIHELFLTRNGTQVSLADLVFDKLGLANSGGATLEDLPSNRTDLRLAQTSDGEIYIMTKSDGMIRQLVGNIAAVPEPSTFAMIGALGLIRLFRRRR